MSNITELKRWYENLDQKSLDKIGLFYDDSVFFKDPFNELIGKDKVKKIFEHMFENLESPRFNIIDTIENRYEWFLTWDYFFGIRGREYKIHGSSHLKHNIESKIVYHRDYWDVGEEILLKIPLIKTMYSYFQNKIALPKEYL